MENLASLRCLILFYYKVTLVWFYFRCYFAFMDNPAVPFIRLGTDNCKTFRATDISTLYVLQNKYI